MAPSKKWLQLIVDLKCTQALLMLQLCMGHIDQNKHLHCIKHINSLACPSCNATAEETIQHFLFICDNYCQECFELQRKLGHNVSKLSYLLTNSPANTQILKYVHSMHCLLKPKYCSHRPEVKDTLICWSISK